MVAGQGTMGFTAARAPGLEESGCAGKKRGMGF